jgi:hypothetical protein
LRQDKNENAISDTTTIISYCQSKKKTMHTFILIIFYGKNDCFEIQISPIVTVRVSIVVNYDTWRLIYIRIEKKFLSMSKIIENTLS